MSLLIACYTLCVSQAKAQVEVPHVKKNDAMHRGVCESEHCAASYPYDDASLMQLSLDSNRKLQATNSPTESVTAFDKEMALLEAEAQRIDKEMARLELKERALKERARPKAGSGGKGSFLEVSLKQKTESGRECQFWNKQYPHTHDGYSSANNNVCIVGTTSSRKVWCYTQDPAVRWEYCEKTLEQKLADTVYYYGLQFAGLMAKALEIKAQRDLMITNHLKVQRGEMTQSESDKAMEAFKKLSGERRKEIMDIYMKASPAERKKVQAMSRKEQQEWLAKKTR